MKRQKFILALLLVAWLIIALFVPFTVHGETLRVLPNTTHHLTPGVTYDKIEGLVGMWDALPDGCKLIGADDYTRPMPIIKRVSLSGYAFKITFNNSLVQGIRFDGGGVFYEGQGGVNTGANLTDCVFNLNVPGGHPKRCAITLSTWMKDFRIERNYLTGFIGSFGIYGDHGYTNGVIANNELVNIGGGMHLQGGGATDNLLIEQNYLRGIRAQAIECQGGGTRLVIQDNWVERPAYQDGLGNSNNDSYSYSVPWAETINAVIRRNISIVPPYTSTNYIRIIYEIGGRNVLMEDNYSDGGNHVIAGNGANGNGIARNNLIKNYREGPRNSNGNTTVYQNNGPTVALSATMQDRIANLKKPGRLRYGATTPAPVPTQPVPPVDDVPALKAKIVELTAHLATSNADKAAIQAELTAAKAKLAAWEAWHGGAPR